MPWPVAILAIKRQHQRRDIHICYSMHSKRVMHAILAVKRQHQSRDRLARASFLVQRQQAEAAERSRTWGVCRELQHSCDASQVLQVEPM